MRHFVLVLTFVLGASVLAGCKPTPRYTADPTGGGAPLEVEFTDDSATLILGVVSLDALFPVTSHQWDFGDGTGSLLASPTHEYENEGRFTVSYTVGNVFGTTTRRDEGLINVKGEAIAPTAAFSSAVTGDDLLTVNFQDASQPGSAAISSWSWNFGDGETSTEQDPTHVYDEPGIYTVILTVSTQDGQDDASEQLQVGRVAPTANFTFQPVLNMPMRFEFKDTSTPGSSEITAWLWDFGDGTTSIQQNVQHQYSESKNYTVTLKVVTADGEDTSDQKVVQSKAPPTPSFTFEVDDANPLQVNFTDTSTPGELPIAEWLWTFEDDGTTSNQQNPTHTYAQAGTFRVRLRVTNASATIQTNREITVTGK